MQDTTYVVSLDYQQMNAHVLEVSDEYITITLPGDLSKSFQLLERGIKSKGFKQVHLINKINT